MDVIIIGFALFAMFFGAGNLIFPPLLGNTHANNWLLASLGFLISGVGITVLSVISMTHKKGDIFKFTSIAGDKLGFIVIIISSLAIGPLGAIPRTAATSAEIVIASGIHIPLWIFSLVFFALCLYFSISENRVIDMIGKFLTPALIVVLAIMIVSGITKPVGSISLSEHTKAYTFGNSLVEGYNTMDAMAALAFTPIIIKTVIDKGYGSKLMATTIKAAFIAVFGLALVYISLTYLGARTSGLYANNISRVELLVFIASSALGQQGKYVLSMIITLACFTTSIGLCSSIAGIFESMTNGRFTYKQCVVGIVLVSTALSLLGVNKIIKFVFPALSFVYPLVILMIIYNLLNELPSLMVRRITFSVVGLVSFIQALGQIVKNFSTSYADKIIELVNWIPMSEYGFPRVLPFILSLALGSLLFCKKKMGLT